MIFKKEEEALSKWPRQRTLYARAGFKLTGSYCPPEIAQLAEGLLWIIGLGALFMSAYYAAYVVPDELEHHFFWPLAGLSLFANLALFKMGVYRALLSFLIGPKLHIIIEPDRIRVGKLFGYKNYPREGLIIPIEAGNHKHTRKEQEKYRKRIFPQSRTPYYCDSLQVIMRFGEKRIVLASIYDDNEKAEALALRIMLAQEALDKSFGV